MEALPIKKNISARIEKLKHEIESGNLQAMSELGRLLKFHGLPFPPRGFALPGIACNAGPKGFRRRHNCRFERILARAKAHRRIWEMQILNWMKEESEEVAKIALGLMKRSDEELIKLILNDRAVVQSGVDEKIMYLDERKMLKAVEEAEMRFGQFAEINQSPRYSTGNKFLDPYVAVLSNRLKPAVAQKLLEAHFDAKANVYNEIASLALWLVGLGYEVQNKTRPEKAKPQMVADLLLEVCDEIKDKNAMAIFGKLLEERGLNAPPNPNLLRRRT